MRYRNPRLHRGGMDQELETQTDPDETGPAGGTPAQSVRDIEKVRTALERAVELRAIIRSGPNQKRRDDAIISYSRLLDDLVEDLQNLDASGALTRLHDILRDEVSQTR